MDNELMNRLKERISAYRKYCENLDERIVDLESTVKHNRGRLQNISMDLETSEEIITDLGRLINDDRKG